MAAPSPVKIYRSPTYKVGPVRAVFPHLNEPDKYGKYDVLVDVLEHPEVEKAILEQAPIAIAEAHKKLDTTKKPQMNFFRDGEYNEQEYRRVSFSLKSIAKRKGKEVKQRPMLVDSQLNPLNEVVWGGSLINIRYHFQYSITPTGTFLSIRLNGVQVLQLVGPGGEASAGDYFDEEEGYVAPEQTEEDSSGASEDADGTPADVQSGRDF